MRLSKDDFEKWWNNPVGEEFRRMIRENLDKLAHGNMFDSFARDTIANSIEIGKYQSQLFIYNLTYDQLMGEE